MSAPTTVERPDFSNGVAIADIPSNGTLTGRVGDQPVLLSSFDGELFAVSGQCTHYGAALGSGLIAGNTVRCPLHHACFDLRTGQALHAPALDDLDRWEVRFEGDRAFVTAARASPAAPIRAEAPQHVTKIVIAGGGAAGLACANRLRKLGYRGSITLLSADEDAPCDRPNLSKDYLAGTAPEEWMPLRPPEWYREHSIDLRLGLPVERIDAESRTVRCAAGVDFAYDRLLLATGSEARRLNGHGFHHPDVLTLRSFSDARALVERAGQGRRAVIVGSSFVGLEAASALRKRGVEVTVVSIEHTPFARVLGTEIGGFLQKLHESQGVEFHLGSAPAGYDGRYLTTANGVRLQADYVLVGIGVAPRLELARSAGLRVFDGVPVDEFLETQVSGIYAAGDIAAYPDPLTGEPVRIEHWTVAERQGEIAAANMLGLKRRFDAVPFFWTEQHGVTVRYVGYARNWDEVRIDGKIGSGEFVVRYFDQGIHRATAAVGRDLDSLADELRFEDAIAASRTGPEAATAPAAPGSSRAGAARSGSRAASAGPS